MIPLNILSFRACLLALRQCTTRGGLYACQIILYARKSKLMQVHYQHVISCKNYKLLPFEASFQQLNRMWKGNVCSAVVLLLLLATQAAVSQRQALKFGKC